jgi:hypothetical protein
VILCPFEAQMEREHKVKYIDLSTAVSMSSVLIPVPQDLVGPSLIGQLKI